MYATVRRMGFRYKRRNKKVSLYEQHRIIAARHDYLRKIQTFRSDNRTIVYETWLNAHHTHERCWLDYDGRGGIRVPSGKGGHEVLRLPVGHRELNRIELVWAQVKGDAADHNKDFTMRAIEQLAREDVENVTAAKWKKCVDHVIQKVENHYRTSDGVVEQAVESLAIEVGAEDSSDSEEILIGDDENDNND